LDNHISLFDGANWNDYTFTNVQTIVTGVVSGFNYDFFVYPSGNAPSLEYVKWASDSARAIPTSFLDGVEVKSTDTTRKRVATLRANATNSFEDSVLRRFVINKYNQERRPLKITDNTDNANYPANTVFRPWLNNSNNKCEFVIGDNGTTVLLTFLALGSNGASAVVFYAAIGLDSASSKAGDCLSFQAKAPANTNGNATAIYQGSPSLGYHYLQLLEYAGTNVDMYGDGGVPTLMQLGAIGHILG
jgi:hypothetical protein